MNLPGPPLPPRHRDNQSQALDRWLAHDISDNRSPVTIGVSATAIQIQVEELERRRLPGEDSASRRG